jgi:nucleoid-associated protein YgaU
MAARRSIEPYLDRTGVLSNKGLMRGADVVAVLTGVPTGNAGHGCVPVNSRPPRTVSPRPAVRLTRRGRIAVVGLSALAAGLLSVVLATGAQATHSGSADPGRYLAKVVVHPGQSLWSLAEAYDPRADPRDVIAQIEQLNSLAADQVQPGQVLWVPRG